MQRREIAIVGVGSTRLGRHGDETSYDLGVQAFGAALDDCGLEKGRIDAIVTNQALHSVDPNRFARVVGLNPHVTGCVYPITCGHVLAYAGMLISTGVCRFAACLFARNFPGTGIAYAGPDIPNYEHGLVGHIGTAAMGWSQYRGTYDPPEEALGAVLQASRAWAALNPQSHHPEPVTMEEYLAQGYLVRPLRPFDIATEPGGAICLVVAGRDDAATLAKKPVYLDTYVRREASRSLENRNHLLCDTMCEVAEAVHAESGLAPADADVTFIYDSTTPVIIEALENYGFCEVGGGPELVLGGALLPGGSVKVNTDGGHLSGGYMQGFNHHAELVRQLRGECGARQVEGAKTALFCTTGLFREDFQAGVFVTE